MKSSARTMVSMLVVATIYWVLTNGGGGLLTRTLETTRAVVDWTDEDFSDYVREFLDIKSRGSDPAMDPWGMPFLLTGFEDSEDWIVFSTGPDQTLDHCDFEGPGGDDICLLIEAAEISR